MLTIYRRHVKSCPHRNEGRKYRRCRCPIWVDGFLNAAEIRKSLGLRDWEKAQQTIRDWEAEGAPASQAVPITVGSACDHFIADAKRRKLTQETLRKYEFLFGQLRAFSADQGIRFLSELELPMLRKFCESWKEGELTVVKKLERLKAFFRFAVESNWIPQNPAQSIKGPKVIQRPTMPFTRDEMVNLLAASDTYPGKRQARRLKAFALLLRYSGLRIGDAARLSRDRITGGKLFLYTQKTGVPVFCPLPQFVVDALNTVESASKQYFFWSGTLGKSGKDGVARNYMRYLNRLFRLAGIKNGHAHRFRDTFAVRTASRGVPIERVSVLLGHSSIKVTERHYAPWVRARQEQLEADVRRTWAVDPILFAATKGTPEVHERNEEAN